jgi:hypothetical protein
MELYDGRFNGSQYYQKNDKGVRKYGVLLSLRITFRRDARIRVFKI